ncbi:hypothetical protein GXW74_15585 [Roseomonas eburnea]|uniref:Mu-like prophage FluMu N-terminal domain-containing protein n=1 Tax=Neoroseomonas eburnea TaxID=1346889 RepID=A0A9X9XDY0_9PROT|nr:hypothetical protein [Neoroseomonas eburnea]
MSPALVILCRRPGFRRAGIAHPARAEYAAGAFTAEQLAVLAAEPMLRLVPIEPGSEGDGGGTASPGGPVPLPALPGKLEPGAQAVAPAGGGSLPAATADHGDPAIGAASAPSTDAPRNEGGSGGAGASTDGPAAGAASTPAPASTDGDTQTAPPQPPVAASSGDGSAAPAAAARTSGRRRGA